MADRLFDRSSVRSPRSAALFTSSVIIANPLPPPRSRSVRSGARSRRTMSATSSDVSDR
jgi:hypothetical protein